MRTYKDYVKNPKRIEGCIVNRYVLDEAILYCMEYIPYGRKGTHKRGQPEFMDDDVDKEQPLDKGHVINLETLKYEQVMFQVADALQLPFSGGQFGTVWSLECGDHLPDKTKFVSELVRVAAPGGTIILATSCLGELTLNEESLKPQERELLQSLCESMYLLEWISYAHYVDLFMSYTMKVRKQLYIQGNSIPHANLAALDKLIAARHELAQVIFFTKNVIIQDHILFLFILVL
ncbi:hypothetical protein GIB67_000073 [Kingdonia uniflora]|uniref:Methyltransferase type 11 domain-containing protein n=1 Tax=Kingdonia uniflora TaxID=39325 RepID=A0A7J7M7N8_9MAGN|nr:hypothetical protein GIB67_000073 [Kingdonia uniflora]